ncbi:hypothetical protein GQX73_g7902 [Xylaria multiplex]|uniref:Cyclochlorotine biosynthesis protein O n=1 Tax=Xylaria multiplex TaxID=323545 RepID=A0A7C8MUA3_9PEZI|nr:hypothetical protein GQX73_g7902 [Xylaria multiplex]
MLEKFNLRYSPLNSSGDSLPSDLDEERRGFIGEKKLCCEKCKLSLETSSGGWTFIPHLSVLLPWTLLVLLSLAFLSYQYARQPREVECARLLGAYSPALESGVIEYYDTTFRNEFGGKTEYGGPPTPELEERWNHLWSQGSVEISKIGVEKLDKSTENLKHASDDPNRGYTAVLEVFHHLHCLNEIRQFTWKDYYATHMAEWAAENGHIIDLNLTDHQSIGDRMHVDHCIEALRLQLMCAGDVTPLLLEIDPVMGERADFNVHHRCRNWERITDWHDAVKLWPPLNRAKRP